jgi:putative transposase
MLEQAKERGFEPCYVLFDSWYSSLDNLKAIRSLRMALAVPAKE